ncbi:MAG: peptidoglycan DD-metalloendopeptidase family protein [Ottowia sp.]|nr:peptidoglycan DD-metalloendopeptidase family protein [Ottowia sp.]
MKQQLIVSTLTVVDFLQTHPRRIGAAVAAVLMGSAGGAYAVATLAPATAQPVHLVTQALEQPTLLGQAQALQEYHLTLYRSERVRASDTAQSLLGRLGVADPDAANFLRSNTLTRQQLIGQEGRQVFAEASEDGSLKALRSTWLEPGDAAPKYKRLLVQRDASGQLQARVESGTPQRSQRLASGIVRSTLRAAVDEAGVPESVTHQMARIFEAHLDVQRALRKGDRFSLVYEVLEADGGEELRAGRVLSAEIEHHGKLHQALWFAEKGQGGSYYSFDGQGLQRAFLSSPLRVPQKITSGFGMRVHPVTGERKGHAGVDYGAPTGTPVYTVGGGKVEFAGTKSGYGKLVIVRHRNQGVETRYAHLSRIDVKEGDTVSAGDLVGAVGATGVATGPHLHFEWRIGDEAVNPLPQLATYREPSPLTAAGKKALAVRAGEMKQQLAAASQMQHAGFE